MKKKILLTVTSVVLVLCFAIGGTLAWLQDQSAEVKNTFTYGDINIDLAETTGDSYKMVPGATITKDPVVSVEANSEACWLFVEVVEDGSVTITENGTDVTYAFDEFLTYALADGWTLLEQTPTIETLSENETYVYYRSVDAATAKAGKDYPVLKNNEVTVNTTVTKAMMNAIDGKNSAGQNVQAELDARPTLAFTAYAVQSANLVDADNDGTTVDEAWAIVKSN